MQNIDPLYILEPVIVIALSVGLILYWRQKRSFTRYALIFSLVAYGGAILVKIIVQLFTANSVLSTFGSESIATGIYYGIQTSLFEVGGAFLVAKYAVSRNRFSQKDAGFRRYWSNLIPATSPESAARNLFDAILKKVGALPKSLFIRSSFNSTCVRKEMSDALFGITIIRLPGLSLMCIISND